MITRDVKSLELRITLDKTLYKKDKNSLVVRGYIKGYEKDGHYTSFMLPADITLKDFPDFCIIHHTYINSKGGYKYV